MNEPASKLRALFNLISSSRTHKSGTTYYNLLRLYGRHAGVDVCACIVVCSKSDVRLIEQNCFNDVIFQLT